MRKLAALAFVATIGSFAAGARADCPHAPPTSGAACEDPGFAACTYTTSGETIVCSCRDGRWACEPMPVAHS